MIFPKSFVGNAGKAFGICPLVAVIDPTPLFLLGCVIILVAILMTRRPVPKSK